MSMDTKAVLSPDIRGELALRLQERNRHLDMPMARYWVDAVLDLLPAAGQRQQPSPCKTWCSFKCMDEGVCKYDLPEGKS